MKKKRRREKANVSAGEAGKYLDTVATNNCSSENVCMVVTACYLSVLAVCVCTLLCVLKKRRSN